MAGEISSVEKNERIILEEERRPLGDLEEKVRILLKRYQEIREERDTLAVALDAEREKLIRLEKKLELLSRDREKVKTRIDQLLHRLRSIDI